MSDLERLKRVPIENLAKVLEIFRVFYNYCKVGEDKQTPTMRLGLAKMPTPLEDVLYFKP